MEIVPNEQRCRWEDCSRAAGPAHTVYGRAYCPQHYFSGVERALLDEIRGVEGTCRTAKFHNLLKRYIEGLLDEMGAPPGLAKLTPSQIVGRGVFSLVTENRMLFSIERHPTFIPITYEFEVDIKNRRLNQLSWEPHYVSVAGFAQAFQFSTMQVRRLIRAGQLEAVRASQLQDLWYTLMLERSERVSKPWDPRLSGFTPRHAWLIPFTEVKRFSQLREPGVGQPGQGTAEPDQGGNRSGGQ